MAQQIPNNAEPTEPFLFLHMSNVEKLTGPNFQSWRAQIESLLMGYGLHDYLTGAAAPPPKTTTSSQSHSDKDSTTNTETPNPAYLTWFRQDKLVYGALATTLGPTIGTLIIRCSTAKEAWDALLAAYAMPSRGHLKVLHHRIKTLKKGSTPIHSYLTQLKAIVDELAVLGDPVKEEDLQDYILGGIGDHRYNGFIESLQFGRDTIMPYPKLLEKFINLEHLLDTTDTPTMGGFPATANATSSRGTYMHQPYPRHNTNQNPRNPFKGKCQWSNINHYHSVRYSRSFILTLCCLVILARVSTHSLCTQLVMALPLTSSEFCLHRPAFCCLCSVALGPRAIVSVLAMTL
ncbi:hypothetical protein vseg_018182 [Gypsophila vaccaria]